MRNGPLEVRMMHLIACDCGATMLTERGRVPSFFLLMAPNGDLHAHQTRWNTPEEKEQHLVELRKRIKTEKITAYSFVTEAWMAKIDLRTQQDLIAVPVKERSDREDSLLIFTRSRKDGHHTTRYHVDYDAEGTVTLGRPQDIMPTIVGVIENLFEEHGNAQIH